MCTFETKSYALFTSVSAVKKVKGIIIAQVGTNVNSLETFSKKCPFSTQNTAIYKIIMTLASKKFQIISPKIGQSRKKRAHNIGPQMG
jgi:hypothetical protein